MSIVRYGIATLAILASASAFGRTTQVNLELIDVGIYDLDTGTSGEETETNPGDCFRECNSEYSGCMREATQNTEDYCGRAYDDFINGRTDRRTYEAIMETCYGMYDVDMEVCSTTFSMCQLGCDAE